MDMYRVNNIVILMIAVQSSILLMKMYEIITWSTPILFCTIVFYLVTIPMLTYCIFLVNLYFYLKIKALGV